jgi:hypothetical protein
VSATATAGRQRSAASAAAVPDSHRAREWVGGTALRLRASGILLRGGGQQRGDHMAVGTMGTGSKAVSAAVLVAVQSGCATGVVQTDEDAFMASKTSAGGAFGDPQATACRPVRRSQRALRQVRAGRGDHPRERGGGRSLRQAGSHVAAVPVCAEVSLRPSI